MSCHSLSWRMENRVLGQLGLLRPPEANWMFGGLITTGPNGTALGALIVGAEHRCLIVLSLGVLEIGESSPGSIRLFRPPEANWMFGWLITTGLNGTALGALVVGAEHRCLIVLSLGVLEIGESSPGSIRLFRPPEANWMFGGLGALIVGAEHRHLDDLPTVSSCSCAASVSQSEVSSTSSCFIWSKVRLHLSVCCWPPVDPTTTFTRPHSLMFVCMCVSIVGACCSPARVRHMSTVRDKAESHVLVQHTTDTNIHIQRERDRERERMSERQENPCNDMLPLFFFAVLKLCSRQQLTFTLENSVKLKVATTTHTHPRNTHTSRAKPENVFMVLKLAFTLENSVELKLQQPHTHTRETHTCQRARKTCIQTFIEYFFFVTFVFGIRCTSKTCFSSKTSVKLLSLRKLQ